VGSFNGRLKSHEDVLVLIVEGCGDITGLDVVVTRVAVAIVD
jgi:hypothetical protein